MSLFSGLGQTQGYQPKKSPATTQNSRFQPYQTVKIQSRAIDPDKANQLHLEQLQCIFQSKPGHPHLQWVIPNQFFKIVAQKYTKYSQDYGRPPPQPPLPRAIRQQAFFAKWSTAPSSLYELQSSSAVVTPHNLETYTLILLNTLIAAPFGYSQRPELKHFNLKKRKGDHLAMLSTKHRFQIFQGLDERGRQGSLDALWLWLSQEMVVDEAMYWFDSFSYLPVQRYIQGFQQKLAELSSGNSITPPATETLLQLMTSRFVADHQYFQTFLFPDGVGRMVVLQSSNNESVLQFEDTNLAEISIVRSIQRLRVHPPVSAYSYLPEDQKDLNLRQQSVLAAISYRKLTIVQGKAGTGKSHLLKVVTRWLERLGVQYQCVAPFNSNVGRLEELGVPALRLRTCTSWRLGFDSCVSLIASELDPYLNKGGVLLVDEGGLVGTHEYKSFLVWLLEKSDTRRMVLFGDVLQLPPVTGGSVMTALMTLLPECVVKLENVERVRNSEQSLQVLCDNILQNDPTVPDSSLITTVETEEELLALFDFQSSVFITMSNKEKNSYNKLLAEKHITNQKKYGKYFVGMRLIVTKTQKEPPTGWDIPISTAAHYDLVPYTKDVIGDFIRSCKKVNPATQLEEWWCELEVQRKDKKPARMMVPSQYVEAGYAVTLHKFQGNECDNVFILVNSWSLQRHANSRWMYTAVTRAKKRLFLVTSHQVGLQYYQKVVQTPAKCLLHTTLIPAYCEGEVKTDKYDDQWVPAASLANDHDVRVQQDGFQSLEPFPLQLVSQDAGAASMTYPLFVRHLLKLFY